MRNEQIMQAARPGQAGLQRCVQDARPFTQQVACRRMGKRRLVLFRADTGPAGEFALEMAGRQANGPGGCRQVWPFLPGVAEIGQGIRHALIGNSALIKRGSEEGHTRLMPCPAPRRHPFLAPG